MARTTPRLPPPGSLRTLRTHPRILNVPHDQWQTHAALLRGVAATCDLRRIDTWGVSCVWYGWGGARWGRGRESERSLLSEVSGGAEWVFGRGCGSAFVVVGVRRAVWGRYLDLSGEGR